MPSFACRTHVVAWLAILLAGACAAQAQPTNPVILVHGLNSNEATWRASVQHLQALGYGTPYTYHFDLNSTTSTAAEADVAGPVVAPYWDFVPFTAALDTSAARVDSVALPADRTLAARAGQTNSRLFAVNFNTWFQASTNTLWVHDGRGVSGHSESNCAAVAKQGLALQRVVRDVLAWTGSDRVTLVGHSMGGLAIREYLQRRDAAGTPRWWVGPAEGPGGHHVAAAVTTGTPHQGSNTIDFGIFGCPDAEATRDLRYSYLSTGETGRYLYGGSETLVSYWHNTDVNADGDEADVVTGINGGSPASLFSPDNPAMPLPRNVAYTYVYSTTDAVVTAARQLVQFLGSDGNPYVSPPGSARALRRDRGHLSQTNDYEMIAWTVANAVWTPGEPSPAAASPAATRIWPNPARSTLTVETVVSQSGPVVLDVVDALGRSVLRLDAGTRPAGPLRLSLDVSRLTPGVYALRTASSSRAAGAVPFSVVR